MICLEFEGNFNVSLPYHLWDGVVTSYKWGEKTWLSKKQGVVKGYSKKAQPTIEIQNTHQGMRKHVIGKLKKN